MNSNKSNLGIMSLFPIAVFLILFVGVGSLSGNFYSLPMPVAFLIALFVAFIQNKSVSFEKKIEVAAKGVGDPNIITMCLIFLIAGAFSGAVNAAGGATSTVNFALSYIPSNFSVVGLFLIGCFVSLAMGTSMGTIAALAPIAVGISNKTGIAMTLCIAAVVSGAMFGDNLSMISDTTIAAVRTQGCSMKDKFKANILIVTPAAILTIIVLFVSTRNYAFSVSENLPYNIFQILPYILVLLGALFIKNVFVLLLSGTALSIIAGLFTGSMQLQDILPSIGSGISSMYEITIISILAACIISIIKNNGAFEWILSHITKFVKGYRGAQFSIGFLSCIMDVLTANNTVAIILSSSIAKDISKKYNISSKRTASILDIFASVAQGLLPFGAQLLSAATFAALSPLEIIPFLFYPMFMAVSAVIFIAFSKPKCE